MPARRLFSVVTACLAVFAGAGCGDRDRPPLPAETDEPYYVQGKQLMKQGRNPEALTSFLKVIDRRGERGAAESHLEAGYIYLHHTKDPVEAYHHFRKYLDLQPNSKEAVRVRGMVEAAKREFARSLPARPLEDQSVRMQAEEALEKLRRENEELRAQIATLRGGNASQLARATPMISLPEEAQPKQAAPPVAAVQNSPAPPERSPLVPAPAIQSPAIPSPARAATPTRPATPAGRTHTVVPKETVYGISTRYYGSGRHVDAIYQANRGQMRNREDVRPGMVLRLPAVDGAAPPRR
jgi:tetratricopeptide (TPR) repeat protein